MNRALLITALDPAGYRRLPWKNGGGTTTDIAFEGDEWRFSRTPITRQGPFSDYAGFERLQVLIAGGGLVLQTPDGEIDLRTPFRPVRFAGETPIVCRLEAGAVEVINLMGKRGRVHLDLAVLQAGDRRHLGAGLHIAYCPAGPAVLRLGDEECTLADDAALRIDAGDDTTLTCSNGRVVLASVACVPR
jgi:environmental stress-induced protein Ves